jgi:hypothetical protein
MQKTLFNPSLNLFVGAATAQKLDETPTMA